MASSEELRRKVDGFLREALAERDAGARAKLIGKATYWNGLAVKAAGTSIPRNPWSERQPTRRV